MTSRPPHLKISALRTLGSFQFPGTRPSPSLRDQTDDLRAVDPITGGDPHRPDHRPLRLVGSSSDSPLEESGFEPSVPPCERVGLKQECECEPGDKDGLERGGHVAGTKDAMGRAAEEMATLSLQFLDGVPRCPNQTP